MFSAYGLRCIWYVCICAHRASFSGQVIEFAGQVIEFAGIESQPRTPLAAIDQLGGEGKTGEGGRGGEVAMER